MQNLTLSNLNLTIAVREAIIVRRETIVDCIDNELEMDNPMIVELRGEIKGLQHALEIIKKNN